MKKNVQLHIPTPCHEDWEAMRPEEKGRFCSSCCKTVIDFSLMSDSEVLHYLGNTAGNVCGRFAGDQLRRDLLSPPQRKRKSWMVWHILMMGLLFAARARGQGKTPKPVSHQVAPGKGVKEPVVMGEPARVVAPEIMGDVKIEEDTIPHYTELPAVVVTGYGRTTGKISVVDEVTVGGAFICTRKKTFIERIIPDTLDYLGIGKKELSLYPNPAERGSTIRLSLNLGGSGNCMIGLYNSAGLPIQIKAVTLTGEPRLELFNLPASMSAGLYFVRVSSPGLKKVYMQKLVVL
ncbi:MAG TPA: T9SS type A sorting domain-containing protein [Puia sp.]